MKFIYLLFLLVALAVGVQAQQASISGTVINDSGIVLKGVEITAKQVKGSAIYKTKSDDSGEYQFPELVASTYIIRAEIKGFAPTEKQVSVPDGQSLEVYLILDSLSAGLDTPLKKQSPLLLAFQTFCASVSALNNQPLTI